MTDARDMVFGPTPYTSPYLETALQRARSLTEYQQQLRDERIKLRAEQLRAENEAAWCEWRIAAIDRRLRAIDAARG